MNVDSIELSTHYGQSLQSLRIQQRLSLPTLCELVFFDPKNQIANQVTLTPGTALTVKLTGNDQILFDGEITAAEYVFEPSHGQELRIRGYDLLHRLRKRQPVRLHVQMTAADLALEMVADLGLAVQTIEQGPLWDRVFQSGQSDLNLLVEMTRRYGLYFFVHNKQLSLFTLEGKGQPLMVTLGESLLEARVELSGESACRSVESMGWDARLSQLHRGHAKRPRTGRKVNAQITPQEVGGTGRRVILDEWVHHDQQADELAQAELDRRTAGEVTLWGVAEGDPRLQPGGVVDVRGIGDAFEGQYVLTSVNHILDQDKGYLAEISTSPPIHNQRTTSCSVTLGIVTSVSDPKNLGRVQVSFPTYSDLESDWLEVLSAGAAHNKGLVVLPDIGDQVLILLPRQDPAHGVVLGGLYGSQGPPDAGVDGGEVKRYTVSTPMGQRVCLDDSRGAIRLENSGESYIDISPDKLIIHAEKDLQIEAPGQKITIQGQRIDFERS